MNNTVKNKEKLQNMKNINSIVKRFSIFTFSLILLLSSFSFSFADSFTNQPIPYVTGSTYQVITGNGMKVCTRNNYNFYVATNTQNADVYVFSYLDPSNNDVYTMVFASVTTFNGLCAYDDVKNQVTTNILDDNTGLYYSKSSIGTYAKVTAEYVTKYDTLNDGLAAVNNYINNNVPIRYPYTFQNGYLFVYDLVQSGALYSFDLSSKSEEYSNIGNNPFPDTNQSYWFDNSLPETDETTIPSSSAITIQWDKGDITNIFGQTQDMIATISGTSTGRYLYIYNPPAHYKWSGSSNPSASETINYPVTINGVSSGDNFYIYDSRALLYDYNQGGKVQGTVTGETGYGSVSSEGAISVTTSEGAIYTQNSGGSTDISGANGGSISENINDLKETLDNFVNQFIQLLSAPISHIQQLIQSSHEFFDVFSQLFEWLPSDLSSVIVSGLIIMVVIGVIKMLL